MASIRPIKNKEGEITSYQITVSAGRVGGKQVRKYKTWTPAPGMTARQIEKALNKEAVQFEEAVQKGYSGGGSQTFGDYAQYVISLKERGGAKHNTIREYHHLMKRIVPAIGHIKLDKLRPQHLNAFYRNLEEQGVADVPDRATAKPDIREKVSTTQKALAAASGLSVNTVALALQGKRVSLSTAQALAAALGRRVEELFTVDKRQEKLSSKTVLEYHRFISAVLAQAEKEMLVTYNAAQKSTPPKLERKEADYFQPEEVEQIRDALEGEPVKWRVVTHLLLITGVRRGELCGLRWDRIDWENQQIKIDRTILYSPDRGIYREQHQNRQRALYQAAPGDNGAAAGVPGLVQRAAASQWGQMDRKRLRICKRNGRPHDAGQRQRLAKQVFQAERAAAHPPPQIPAHNGEFAVFQPRGQRFHLQTAGPCPGEHHHGHLFPPDRPGR